METAKIQNSTETGPSSIKPKKSHFAEMFASIVIPLEIGIAILLFMYVFGNGSNFEGGDPKNHPLPGNYLGIIYKGGTIVPILISLFLMVITFSLERFFTIAKANGRGNLESFISKIKENVSNNNIDSALTECDKQRGSLGNVMHALLKKYKEMQLLPNADKEHKISKLQLELEGATQFEMPMLEKNLIIIATISSIGTLIALLGTVLGMIKAFSALATSGAPDAVALANGISEALVNTALGIATSALAIIAYNFFTSKIDTLSYNIDEAGQTLIKIYETNH